MQRCLGTRLQGEALHCGRLWKITAKCLKIVLCLFLYQSSGQPDGLEFGVCFEVPVDTFQTAQLWCLSTSPILFYSAAGSSYVCSLHSPAASTSLLGANKEEPCLECGGWNRQEVIPPHEERAYSLSQPADLKCINRSVSFCHVFVLHYLKKKKKKTTKNSRAGLAHGCLHRTVGPAPADLPLRWGQRRRFWLRCNVCLLSSWNVTSSRPKK